MADLQGIWPGLARTEYFVTSPEDSSYNCLAYAAGDEQRWWQPDDDYYWPPNARRDHTLDAWIDAFSQFGFQPRESDEVDGDVDLLAIYIDRDGIPTHVARRTPDGSWTSKLGEYEDITHELAALEGDFYGSVSVFLSRPPASEEAP